MHVLYVYFLPTREMRRMAMIWIVIRYCCHCQPCAWGTALANRQPSQSRAQGSENVQVLTCFWFALYVSKVTVLVLAIFLLIPNL